MSSKPLTVKCRGWRGIPLGFVLEWYPFSAMHSVLGPAVGAGSCVNRQGFCFLSHSFSSWGYLGTTIGVHVRNHRAGKSVSVHVSQRATGQRHRHALETLAGDFRSRASTRLLCTDRHNSGWHGYISACGLSSGLGCWSHTRQMPGLA